METMVQSAGFGPLLGELRSTAVHVRCLHARESMRLMLTHNNGSSWFRCHNRSHFTSHTGQSVIRYLSKVAVSRDVWHCAVLYRGGQAFWADLMTLSFFFLFALALTNVAV